MGILDGALHPILDGAPYPGRSGSPPPSWLYGGHGEGERRPVRIAGGYGPLRPDRGMRSDIGRDQHLISTQGVSKPRLISANRRWRILGGRHPRCAPHESCIVRRLLLAGRRCATMSASFGSRCPANVDPRRRPGRLGDATSGGPGWDEN